MNRYCLKNSILFVIGVMGCVGCATIASPEIPQTIPDTVSSIPDEVTINDTLSSQESENQTPLTDELVAGSNTGNSQTLNPIDSSELMNGWLVYHNGFYNYEISYPPTAILSVEGVNGFPAEEKPSDLTNTQYLSQLRERYPSDICLSLQYESGFVSILAPFENGGKYANPCPGSGIGDYTLQEIAESVVIHERTYTASGYKAVENEGDGIWHGEILSFQMDDGTVITFGGGFDGQTSSAEYLVEKEVLLEILSSYQVK